MGDPAAGKDGTYYVPFPVLGLTSDGQQTFLAAGGGGSTASKEVPNVVHAMTYSEATGKLSTIAALDTAKAVVVNLTYSKSADLWLASLSSGCKVLKLSREENALTELCEWQTEESGKEPEQNFAKYSPDASMIVTGGTDGQVKLWDAGRPEKAVPVLKRLCGNKQGEIEDAEFSPDSKFVAACDGGGSCRLWDVVKEDPVDGTVITFNATSTPRPGKAMIKLVKFAPSSGEGQPPVLVLGANSGRSPSVIGLFSLDGTKLREVICDKQLLKSVSMSGNHDHLCYGLMSGAKVVYSYPALKVVKKTKELHSLPSQRVAILADGTVISGSGDRSLHLLSLSSRGGSPMTYVLWFLFVLLVVCVMVMRIGLKGARLGQDALGF